jgi:RNA polymerase sigma-70 factor (ECF subfamily)
LNEQFTYPEKELLQRIAEGSEAAFRQLFDAYRKKLYTYIYRITESKEVAEDTVQDIFLKIWAVRDTLPNIDNINAYLHRMAHNYAHDGFKRLAKESLLLEGLREQSFSHKDASHELISKEVRVYIQGIIDQLTPQQRKVFILSREEGLKQEEIAVRLNLSLTTVKKHMVDALRYLREEIGKSYGSQAIALYVVFGLSMV